MAPDSLNGHDGKYHTRLSTSKKDIVRTRTVKTGMLKTFFAWIARGTSQSAIGKQSCPT